MKAFLGKTRLEMKLLAAFIAFTFLFTFMRYQIGEVAAWILSFSNEVTLSDSSEEFDSDRTEFQKKQIKQAKQQAKKSKSQKKKQAAMDRDKPVTLNRPKTTTPVLLITENLPSWQDKVFSDFPALRKPNGNAWGNEKTQIRLTSDGRKLNFLLKLTDKFPDKAITKFSQSNAESAWQDDSVEIFLMKDIKDKFYCQFIVSVSGIGNLFYMKTSENAYTVSRTTKPADFDPWNYDVTKFDDRFEMEITIPLSNIGITKLKPGDSLLLQIVRNYRGQGGKGSVATQLFPTHIYADKRFGLSNHDRRAFKPVKVIDATVFSTLEKSDETFLKEMN